MTDLAAEYERAQNFNLVTRWLHGHRYRHSMHVMAELAQLLDRPVRVLEIGCGQGKLFGQINGRFAVRYTGIDLQPAFVDAARRRYGHLTNFRAEAGQAQDVSRLDGIDRPDVVFALETFEHIAEAEVAEIVGALARLELRRFVCSVPVEVGPALLAKNVGSWLMGYERHNEYSWRETWDAACYRLERLPPHAGGHKGFDWRSLDETLRRNFAIVERRHLPLRLLPAALSTSVYFVARPD